MTALDALYSVTALGLAAGAVSAGRAGASRALAAVLAAVLAVNAVLVARAVFWGAAASVGSAAATAVAVSLFAAVPPLLALAAVRARSGGPLRSGDALALGPYTGSGAHLVHSTMKALEARLPDAFVRVHRSYLVRTDQIGDVEDSSLVIGRKMIPVGATYRAPLVGRLNTL